MLVCWIVPRILGAGDTPHWLLNEAWSMAKIKRLFPDWELPDPDDCESGVLKVAVRSAIRMSREEPEMTSIIPFKEEIQKVEVPQQLTDLLRIMLIPNPEKRPSASFVLTSKEFRAFEKFACI
jgi:hypothetical protein